MPLAQEKCEPCHEGTQRVSPEEAEELLEEIPQWTLKDNSVEREFRFKDFRGAVDFVLKVADIAEKADHHPDICIYYNKVHVELLTHKIGGLSKNDFIVAAKIDSLQ